MLGALKTDIHHNFKSQMTEKKKLVNLKAHSPGTLVNVHGFPPAQLSGG